MGTRLARALLGGAAFVYVDVLADRQATTAAFWPLLPGLLAASFSPHFAGVKDDHSGPIAYLLMYGINIIFYGGIA